MKLKFVYWFAYYNLDSPSVRYRGWYPLSYFSTTFGINSYFILPGYSIKRIYFFLQAYFSALFFQKKNSIIVIQRVNSNFIYANALKILVFFKRRYSIYDLDDADYKDHKTDTIYHFIENCSTVTLGSHELMRSLPRHNENKVLNTSPTPDLRIIKDKKNPVLTLGWIGGFAGGHRESLMNGFFEALRDLPFKIKLVLIGIVKPADRSFLENYFRDFQDLILEMPRNLDWTNEAAIQNRIVKFDIGIATLIDDEYHRSKSAFKTKQYLNNGIPVLSSPVPENNLFVKDGENGYLCNSVEEFRSRIIAFNEMDADTYLKMSKMARSSISEFNLDFYCTNLISCFDQMKEMEILSPQLR